MEGVRLQLGCDGVHLLLRDLDAAGVGVGVGLGVHGQAGASGRGSDEVHDYFVAGQRAPSPVHRDVREQPVFDLVPFAGAGWEVADGDGPADLSGEPCELNLPESDSVAVGAAGVGADQQPLALGVANLTDLVPPAAQRSTANAAVSPSQPTDTQPVFAARS